MIDVTFIFYINGQKVEERSTFAYNTKEVLAEIQKKYEGKGELTYSEYHG